MAAAVLWARLRNRKAKNRSFPQIKYELLTGLLLEKKNSRVYGRLDGQWLPVMIAVYCVQFWNHTSQMFIIAKSEIGKGLCSHVLFVLDFPKTLVRSFWE